MSENLIQFPEAKSKKILEKNQHESRQILVAFSMVSFILVAVFSSEQMLKGQRPTYVVSDMGVSNQSRSIASLDGASSAISFRDLEWEKKLAQKLSSSTNDDRLPASVGIHPSASEMFRLQYADKYLIHLSQEKPSKVLSMTFVESETGENPLHIRYLVDDENILIKNRSLFPIEYESVKKDESAVADEEVFSLLNVQGLEVGKAIFKINDEGRVLALYFRN